MTDQRATTRSTPEAERTALRELTVRPAPLPGSPPTVARYLAKSDSHARTTLLRQIQRSAGNSSVQRLLASHALQRCTATTICPECAAAGGKDVAKGGAAAAVQGDWMEDAAKLAGGAVDAYTTSLKQTVQILSCTAPARLITLLAGVSATTLDILVGHVKAGTMPSLAEAKLLEPVVEKLIINGLCSCLPDRVITGIALHVYLAGQPLAQRHLEHYLSGGGRDFIEDINDLFRRNPTIANNVAAQIAEQSDSGRLRSGVLEGGGDLPGGGKLPGFPPITQSDYDDQDWRNSIGNVDRLEWVIVSGPDAAGNATVMIKLADPYAWHPQEARLSQCVHQAIDNMKAHGAKEYMARGTGVVVVSMGSVFKEGPNEGAR